MDLNFENRLMGIIDELVKIRQELADNGYENGYGNITDAIIKIRHTLGDVRMPKNLQSSLNPIKSSLEDRLIPYLEEFEEGFANTQVVAPGDEMDIPSRQETFFEIFKNDYNLSDEDINKLKDAVMGIWEATAGN